MCAGSLSSGLAVFVLLLCNGIILLATPAQLSEWQRLQVFDENADKSPVTREDRQPSTSASPSHSSPSPLTSMSQGCSGCRSLKNADNDRNNESRSSSMISDEEKEFRVEAVKQQILKALRLPDAPVKRGQFPEVDQAIIEKIFMESSVDSSIDEPVDETAEDQEPAHAVKKLILGVADEARGYGNSRVKVSFLIPLEIQRATSVRGKLWVSVAQSSSATKRSLIVIQRFSRRSYFTPVVGSHRLIDAAGWVSINLSSAWSASENTVHLEVISDSPQSSINISASPILEPFSIGRDDLNWDWIVYPTNFEVNYCRGSCETGSSNIYNHSSIMYTRGMEERNASLRDMMLPCCTPKRLGNVQFIYYSEGSALATKVIPNLRVLECGCA